MNEPLFISILVNDIGKRRSAGLATRGSLRNDIQAKLDLEIPQRLHGLFLSHAQLAGIGCSRHPFFDFPDHGGSDRVTGDPPVFWFNPDRTQHALRLGFVLRLPNPQRLDQLNRKNTLRYQRLSDRRIIGTHLVRQGGGRRSGYLPLSETNHWDQNQSSDKRHGQKGSFFSFHFSP
jgi:hypothetical protein